MSEKDVAPYEPSREVIRFSKLRVLFPSKTHCVHAVDEVSFSLSAPSSFALMGESGSGKSVMASTLLRLLPKEAIVEGRISAFGFDNLLDLPIRRFHRLRGTRMVLIPQNPLGSLHPMFRIDTQVRQTLRVRGQLPKRQEEIQVNEALLRVGFSDPKRIARMFPHELSGGMAQRVLLAVGVGVDSKPDLIIADEPTKGVDAADREHLVALLLERFDQSTILLITHDPWIAKKCQQMAVMYAGEWVETGESRKILDHPLHPYTQGLLAAHPRYGLHPIQGFMPEPSALPTGCRFHPRCHRCDERCRIEHPEPVSVDNRMVRCFHASS
uniref:Nickel import system ATP-binding protein NikD n=1 Tax=Desulfatirhabdium butyrativorans TaxID=340467 RepID=A0A7C4MNY6_9BACT